MPINVNVVTFSDPATQAQNALMGPGRFNIPAVDGLLFVTALANAIVNWAMTALDTGANPGNGVLGGGNATYTDTAGNNRNYFVSWQVNAVNWILHQSVDVYVANVW